LATQSPGPLQGKVAIVTGASSGIGASAGRLLAQNGCAVALVARRADRLESMARSIEASGGRALAVPADVTKEEEVGETVARARKIFGSIDILVNAAGILRPGAIEHAATADWMASKSTPRTAT